MHVGFVSVYGARNEGERREGKMDGEDKMDERRRGMEKRKWMERRRWIF